jgi:adenylate kinase
MKIIFLGSPGSGKSTQAKTLAEKLNLPYIEMGQIFRDRATQGDPIGQKIQEALKIGILVEDEIAVKTLQEKLAQEQCKSGYVLDGYPRNEAQLKGLETDINMVFYINISEDEAIKRLSLRARVDETKEVLAKRLETYHQLTEPLLDYFREKGVLKEIDGQKSIEEVQADVIKVYEANAKI